jgi:hypothetical protein
MAVFSPSSNCPSPSSSSTKKIWTSSFASGTSTSSEKPQVSLFTLAQRVAVGPPSGVWVLVGTGVAGVPVGVVVAVEVAVAVAVVVAVGVAWDSPGPTQISRCSAWHCPWASAFAARS